MKSKYLLAAVATLAIVLVSCSLGNVVNAPGSSGSQASPNANAAALTVATDSSRNQGILTTAGGSRIDVTALADDGTVVNCVDAAAVVPIGGSSGARGLTGSQNTQALIIGTRNDGKPGVWAFSSSKIQAVMDEDSGSQTSSLPELADMNGAFRGPFGWVYHVMGVSTNGNGGGIIIGYAQNTRRFWMGNSEIDQGTTIGVYWNVSRHPVRPCFLASRAHIIGTFDFSSIPSRKIQYLVNLIARHSLAQLQYFLLNFLTSYLSMVDKNGVQFDSTNNVYQVTGLDQGGQPAVATIDMKGTITIAPVQQQSKVDLIPTSITYTAKAVQQNTSLAVSLSLQNLQSGSVSKPFTVDFYLALSRTFSPSTDAHVGSASVAGIGGSTSIPVPATLSIPSVDDECVYIYAVVDAAGVTGDINTANNISTPATAAVVLGYATPSPQTYYMFVETYPGSGSGTNNTEITLYKANSTNTAVSFVGDNKPLGAGRYGVLDFTSLGLQSGTYYALVSSVAGSTGPYAFNVRTANIDPERVPDLSTDPSTGTDNALDPWHLELLFRGGADERAVCGGGQRCELVPGIRR